MVQLSHCCSLPALGSLNRQETSAPERRQSPGAGMDGGVREMGLGKVDGEGTLRVRDRNPTSTDPTEAKSSLCTLTPNY